LPLSEGTGAALSPVDAAAGVSPCACAKEKRPPASVKAVAASSENRVGRGRFMVSGLKRQEGPSCDDSNQQRIAHETIESDYLYQVGCEVLICGGGKIRLPSEGIFIS
jgi:hypothetical protein